MLLLPIHVVIMFAASLLLVNLAIIAWDRRSVPGSLVFSWVLLGASLWCFGAGMENLVATQAEKIAWTKIEYIGILSVTPLTYFMVKMFLGETKFRLRHQLAVWVLPVFILILVMTNEWHGIIWRGFSWGDAAYNILIYERGWGYWLNIIFVFGMLLYLFVILLVALKGAIPIRKKQIMVLLLGIIAPWITAMIYLTGIVTIQYLDVTPIGFFFTGLIILVGFSSLRLFNLFPMASEKLLQSMSNGVILINSQNGVDFFNPAAKTLLDLPNLKINDPIEALVSIDSAFIRNSQAELTFPVKNANGLINTLKIEKIALTEKKQKVIGMILVIHDLTKLLALEKELHKAEVTASTINERRRIGRELHDMLTQSLHSIVFSSELAQRQLKNGKYSSAESAVALLRESALHALKEIRLLLYEMQLEEPERQDMLQAVRRRLDLVERRAGIQAEITVIPEDLETIDWDDNLYGIVMEALNNVTRHSKADHIWMWFESTPENLTIKIKDNGEGFDTQEKRAGGLGIQIMRDRANIMGGLLETHSSPGAGTEIVFSLEKKI